MPRGRSRLARGVSSSLSFLSKLIDRAPDVVFRVRLAPRPRLEYINRAVLAATGYSPDEWYADPELAARIVHPADRRKLQDVLRLRRMPAQPAVVRLTRKDGSAAQIEVSAAPVHGRDGSLVAIEGIARDVTGSRPEASAPIADRVLRAAFEQAPTGLAHLASDGRFLHVNRRLCEMTGFPPDELLARRFPDISHTDDAERDVSLLRQLAAADDAHASVEKRCVCRDGTLMWVRVTAARLSDSLDSIAVIERAHAPTWREDERRRLTYSGIEIDLDRLDVNLEGRPVAMTLKEVLLLSYLIRHRGEMLARDRLLRDVWGYEHVARSRTLDVHVCRLRRKLPPLADALVTIGHFGYTLGYGTEGVSAEAARAG